MIVLHVTIQVKPEHVAEFLQVVRATMRSIPKRTRPAACVSMLFKTATTPIVSIFMKSTAMRRRWQRTAKHRTSNTMRKRHSLGSPRRQSVALAQT